MGGCYPCTISRGYDSVPMAERVKVEIKKFPVIDVTEDELHTEAVPTFPSPPADPDVKSERQPPAPPLCCPEVVPREDAWVIVQSLGIAFAAGALVGGVLAFAFSKPCVIIEE